MIVTTASAQPTPPVGERDHAQGPATAPVTLVEYGDYECPYCGLAHAAVRAVQEHLGDRLRFVFRNFPLTEVHPHAEHAAEAAEAAGTQGRFWQMHDTLYEHQDALSDAHLVRYAAALGLNVERFEREMASHAYAARVAEDFRSGTQSGVRGTQCSPAIAGRPGGAVLRDRVKTDATQRVPRAPAAASGCGPPRVRWAQRAPGPSLALAPKADSHTVSKGFFGRPLGSLCGNRPLS